MKKILAVLQKILVGIAVVLATIFYTLLSVVKTPFLAAEYRKTAFAEDSGADYEAGVTETIVYRLYNRLRKAGISIGVLAHPKHAAQAHLLWQDTLIIHEIDRVGMRDGRWVIGPGSPVWKEGLDLKEAISEVLEDAFDDRPGVKITNAVVLLDRSRIPLEHQLEAEHMPMFLLYENEEDLFEILKTYCG